MGDALMSSKFLVATSIAAELERTLLGGSGFSDKLLLLEIVLGLSSKLTVLVCVCCIPLTAVVVLLPLEADTAMICCFHEACVSFASVATAATSWPSTWTATTSGAAGQPRLTMGRAVALLGSIWAYPCSVPGSLMEVGFFISSGSDLVNQTAVAHTNEYYTEPGLYYHLLAQIPISFLRPW
ncbi:hypothetical protein INR49_002166 [Caranx melampygus]|nr:hypothetical protein INR49_002166 [Caranx melampygus]